MITCVRGYSLPLLFLHVRDCPFSASVMPSIHASIYALVMCLCQHVQYRLISQCLQVVCQISLSLYICCMSRSTHKLIYLRPKTSTCCFSTVGSSYQFLCYKFNIYTVNRQRETDRHLILHVACQHIQANIFLCTCYYAIHRLMYLHI